MLLSDLSLGSVSRDPGRCDASVSLHSGSGGIASNGGQLGGSVTAVSAC